MNALKHIKYSATIAFLLLILSACGNSESKNIDANQPEEQDVAMDLEERAARDSTVKAMPKTTIEFEEVSHDFGTAAEGDILKHTFKFKNTGSQPYLISNVHTPCGCTEPKYSKRPILPGESGTIEMKFNTQGKTGKNIDRPLTIYGNTEKEVRITFSAEVIKQ